MGHEHVRALNEAFIQLNDELLGGQGRRGSDLAEWSGVITLQNMLQTMRSVISTPQWQQSISELGGRTADFQQAPTVTAALPVGTPTPQITPETQMFTVEQQIQNLQAADVNTLSTPLGTQVTGLGLGALVGIALLGALFLGGR